jgi:hypothetical protein
MISIHKIGLTCCVILMMSPLYSQVQKTVQRKDSVATITRPLQSQGTYIPERFFYTAETWYKSGEAWVSKEKKKENKLLRNRFLILSAKNTADLFQSGKVLFGDPLSKHVEQVAAVLLKEEKELASNLHFYVVNSEGLTPQYDFFGNIFVPVALLAQIENDAQLAFMLAMNIAFYEQNAGFEIFQEIAKKINTSNIISAFNFEKMEAMEADYNLSSRNIERALKLVNSAKFDTENASYALDMMYHKTAAIEDIPFDFSYFKSKGYNLPIPSSIDSFYIPFEGIPDINELSEFNDDYALLKATYKKIQSSLEKGKNVISFVESESKTMQVKKMAWAESIRKQLVNGSYQKAFYNAYCLLSLVDKNSEDYLNVSEMMGKALYLYGLNKQFIEIEYAGLLGLPILFNPIIKRTVTKITFVKETKEESKSNTNKEKANESKIEIKYVGEYNKVYQLLNQSSPADLLLMGTRLLWETAEINHSNKSTLHFAQKSLDLTAEYFYKNNIPFVFSTYNKTDDAAIEKERNKRIEELEAKLKEPKLDKYEKLALQKELNTLLASVNGEENQYVYVFHNLLSESKLFKNAIDNQIEKLKSWDLEKSNKNNLSVKQMAEIEREKENKSALIANKGYSLGISNVVVLSATLNRVSAKRKDKHLDRNLNELINNDEKVRLMSNVKKAAKSNKVNALEMNNAAFSKTDVERYNELILLSDIIEEIRNLFLYQNRKNQYISDNYNAESYRASLLAEKLNSAHFALHFLDEISYVNTNSRAANLLLSVFLYPLAPYFLPSAFGMDYETTTTSVLVDIQKGKVVLASQSDARHRSNNAVQRQHLFTFYKQIKRSSK